MSTALITGASAGIGETFAIELAARNTNLVLVARSDDKLQQLAQRLRNQYQIQVDVIVQDLTEPDAATAVYTAVQQQGRTIDLLINNAGFGSYGAFTDIDLSTHLNIIQLNVTALVALTYQFLPEMQQRRSGSIINLSSTAGFQPLPYLNVYAATKAFVLSFSESLWAENKQYGVRVLAVCPGPTDTKFFQDAKFPPNLASQATQTYSSKETVVRQAIAALETNDANIVPGNPMNQLFANIPRFLPRRFLTDLIEKQFRPRN